MRLFLAIEVPSDLRDRLAVVQHELPDDAWRWVSRENLHLTLKFLGETDPNQVLPLSEAIETITARRRGFELSLSGLDLLPPPEKNRLAKVLYAGIDRGREELTTLAAEVEEAASEAGFKPDRHRFRGHATLARVRRGKRPQGTALLLDRWTGREFGSWFCNEVVLFESVLGKRGPTYTKMARFPFG